MTTRFARRLRAALLAGTALSIAQPILAADWLGTTTDYNLGSNWTGGSVPGSGETANFLASSPNQQLSLSGDATAGTWTVLSGGAYQITNVGHEITLDGSGIDEQTGGSLTYTGVGGASLTFKNNATAGTASISNVDSFLVFEDNASAGNATINPARGMITFSGSSSAGNATIQGNGSVEFLDNATGANARLTISGASTVDFENALGPNGDRKISVGSIAGTTEVTVNLSAAEVSIGGNNESTSIDGLITGVGGTLVKVGTGDLAIYGAHASGPNTYSGGTIVAGGSLTATSTALGTGGVTIKNGAALRTYGDLDNDITLDGGGTLVALQNSDVTVRGDVSGDGTLRLQGGLTFLGTMSPTGGTVASNAVLTFGDATHMAELSGSLETDGSNLTFVNADLSDVSTITAHGRVTFLGTMSAAATSIDVENSLLVFDDDSNAGTATIHAVGGGMAFADNSSAANATLRLDGNSSANLFFQDNSTAGHADLMFAGDSWGQFLGRTTAGDAKIALNGAGNRVLFSEQSDGGRAQVTLGAGSFLELNSNFTGANNDDTAHIGSVAGAGQVRILDNRLVIGGNNLSTEFSGQITGTNGSIGKEGTGTLTLSGNSSYTGATTVNAGKLVVNGSLASSGITINGGTLGGTGTVRAVTIASGGAVAPGNSIGTMHVTGDVTFDTGSFLDVEVNAAGASDLLAATGDVIINGGTVRVTPEAGRYKRNTAYTIITADSVTGSFDDAATTSLAFVDPVLSYGAQSVTLTLTRNSVDFEAAAATGNQKAAGAAIEALGDGNAVYDAIAMLTEEEARAAFDALSGEGHATIKGLTVENSTLITDALLGRLQTLRAAPRPTAANGYLLDDLLSSASISSGRLWGQLYGSVGSSAASANAAAASFGIGGLVIGSDTEINDWTVGLTAQIGGASFSIPDRATSGDTADLGLGVYAGTQLGDTSFTFGATASRQINATTRKVDFPGFSETLLANYGSTTGLVFGEVSHEFDLGATSITPFAQLAVTATATDGFTETGGAAALTSAASTTASALTTLGVRAAHQLVIDGNVLTINGSLAWRHNFGSTLTASNAFAGGTAFAVAGAPQSTDALLLGTGLALDLATGLDLTLDYSGKLAAQGQSHSISAALVGTF